MKTKDFYYFYDLYDLDIIHIYTSEDNKLVHLVLKMDIKMDYIANGLRSDFNYSKTHTFTFSNKLNISIDIKDDIKVEKYELKDDESIYLKTNKGEIILG